MRDVCLLVLLSLAGTSRTLLAADALPAAASNNENANTTIENRLPEYSESGIYYDLYTQNRPNISEKFHKLNPETLKGSSFDYKKPTVFLVPGWLGLGLNPFSKTMRKAYLTQGDYNVFHVTYLVSKNSNYNYVADRVPSVGRRIGLAINDLLKTGTDPDKITIIGFSLGCHVAGVAGQYTSPKVGRVVGLDPTGIRYRNVNETKRISVRSATYVEVVHTSALLGFPEALGHVDFFVNGGKSQPCFSVFMPDCSHPRSIAYYVEAMFNKKAYVGVRCSSFEDFKRKKCYGDRVSIAAEYDPRNPFKRGKYYLYTRDRPPRYTWYLFS